MSPDRGDHLRLDRIDHADVSGVGVHHPDRAGRRVPGDSIGLGPDLQGRDDRARRALEEGCCVGGAIGRNDLGRAGYRHRRMAALRCEQGRRHRERVEVDRHDAGGPRHIEPVAGGRDVEQVPAAIRSGDPADDRIGRGRLVGGGRCARQRQRRDQAATGQGSGHRSSSKQQDQNPRPTPESRGRPARFSNIGER